MPLKIEGYALIGDCEGCALVGDFPQAFSHIGLINAAFNLGRRGGRGISEQTIALVGGLP